MIDDEVTLKAGNGAPAQRHCSPLQEVMSFRRRGRAVYVVVQGAKKREKG